MTVNSKMTAIADKIRSLLGITGKMGLDAMATNLEMEQTNVSNAFTVIGNKGGTVPSSKVSGNIASAIDSIPTGVTVQTKSGTFTTNSYGTATANCGFKPDFVAIDGGTYQGTRMYNGTAFTAGNVSKSTFMIMPANTNTHIQTSLVLSQTSTGFSVTAKNLASDWSATNCSNRTLSYVAVKYT